jgi:lipopolysaccharide transport system permease protein
VATAPEPVRPDEQLHVIRPGRGWIGLDLRELWSYRELLWVFTWRNVLVRYKQTVLGILWAILQPVFLMVVFVIVINRLGNQEVAGLPYPVFAYAGLLPWTLFGNSLTQTATSLVGSSNLLRKVYFPRLVIPLSVVLTAIVDFLVASLVLIGLMAYYDVGPEPIRLLALPGLLVLALAAALGVGLWLSALNVSYRDVQYVVPFLSQIWLFATPAVYLPAGQSPDWDEPWRTLVGLNPMQGVIAGVRWAVIDRGQSPGWMLAVSAGVVVVVLAGGLVYFKRMERSFADIV